MSKIIPIKKSDRLRPDSLSPGAKELWSEYYRMAVSVKLLSDDDLVILAGLCEDLAVYHKARAVVNEEGFVRTLANGEQEAMPEYWIMSAASERVLEKLRSLGMTPMGRAELGIY